MRPTHDLGGWTWIIGALLLPLPAVALAAGPFTLPLLAETLLFGLAICGAAFLVTWAAEAAELEIGGALALALLALVAMLPEYAVDLYFAWTAGRRPEYAAFAAANMIGANRLLIGLGLPLVVLLFWLVTRRPRLKLTRSYNLELGLLAAALLYGAVIALKRSIAPIDSLVLLGLFAAYLWLAAHKQREESDLVGPAESIGRLSPRRRRLVLAGLFLYAALIIGLAAEKFAGGLVDVGAELGIDRVLLVQWVAPLASEAPELIAALLLSLRGRATNGVGVLLSSSLNQWTLLIGGLPLAYSLSRGTPAALPLDSLQSQDLLLIGAQALFACALCFRRSLPRWPALLLLTLFLGQLLFQDSFARVSITIVFLAATLAVSWRSRVCKIRCHTT